jgi:hypothetical protein
MNVIPYADQARALATWGFVHPSRSFATSEDAWNDAFGLIRALAPRELTLDVIGDFVLPPADGPPSRDFQTLHFDFGLPLVPRLPADVARFTALHIPADVPASGAMTRLVPLERLLAGRSWPCTDELLERFAAYGRSHGARDDSSGYVEGSLARIVEAAIGESPVLPSVKTHGGFRCGTEFASLSEETDFFAQRNLPVATSEIEVCLNPGELLIFDNLVVAHGRRGIRRAGELRQRVFGQRSVAVERQVEIRDRVLASFAVRPARDQVERSLQTDSTRGSA